jgi:hypothetical protein
MLTTAVSSCASGQPPTYYLVWRSRPQRPWQSEELLNRFDAHRKYLALIERGCEAYLEKREKPTLSA